MKVTDLKLAGLKLVELDVHGDHRGFFVERYHEKNFHDQGLPMRMLQDNHSRSAPGIIRGLHYQYDSPQGKLVGVVRGKIFDVVVDIRAQSETFGKTFSIELDDQSGKMLWVPPGFAHGFYTMGDDLCDVIYKVDSYYNPKGEAGISWSDPELAIEWPIAENGSPPTVSSRDAQLDSFATYRKNPKF